MHLGVGHDLERNGGQVERIHDKVHQVPPVVDVILETSIPHLFDLGPDESWTGRAAATTQQSTQQKAVWCE